MTSTFTVEQRNDTTTDVLSVWTCSCGAKNSSERDRCLICARPDNTGSTPKIGKYARSQSATRASNSTTFTVGKYARPQSEIRTDIVASLRSAIASPEISLESETPARPVIELTKPVEQSTAVVDLPAAAPLPRRKLIARFTRHRHLMHYNRLIVGICAVNLLIFIDAIHSGWWSGAGINLPAIALVAQVNLVIAALPRQQWAVNLIGWLATRPSINTPLRLRWLLGKYYHFGGIHVGAGGSGMLWYLVFTLSAVVAFFRGTGNVSALNMLLIGAILGTLTMIIAYSTPARRARDHDKFELTHRFGAWSVLLLVWLNTVAFVHNRTDGSLIMGLLSSPSFWLVTLSTGFTMWPWMLLRRVPITVEHPSDHCVIVKFSHGRTPGIGTTRPISRKPFVDWHHFACVPAAPGESGYRMLISRAGDWTSDFIENPPTHVWVRGWPAVGVANVRQLFSRVVFVVTGSGIGPALGHLLASEATSKLIWVTRDPRATYGDGLVDEVLAQNPDAVIWNTQERGRPDMLQLAYDTYAESGADAVICISNRKITWQVVQGMESRGIPAFGPIWDS